MEQEKLVKQGIKQCKQCGDNLLFKRDDAKFCDANCRQKYYLRKKKITDTIRTLRQKIVKNKEAAYSIRDSYTVERPKLQERIGELQIEIEMLEKRQENTSKVLALSNQGFERFIVDEIRKDKLKNRRLLQIIDYGTDRAYYSLINQQYQKREEEYDRLAKQIHQLRIQLKAKERAYAAIDLKEINAKIHKFNAESAAYKAELDVLNNINLRQLPILPRPKYIKQKRKVIEKSRPSLDATIVQPYSASEVLHMRFDSITLNGNLGKFLGKLQKVGCAIILRGDKGSGKSTFSYKLANAFAIKKMKIGYFSLEMSFTENMQKMIKAYELHKHHFQIFGEGNLSDIRAYASKFDCIIIDSFTKLKEQSQEFENLRKDFPDVYFIAIFQENAQGKTRNGNEVEFDCTALIRIKVLANGNRIAYMEKSRFGTMEYVYSITEDKILKSDNTPLDWKKYGKM